MVLPLLIAHLNRNYMSKFELSNFKPTVKNFLKENHSRGAWYLDLSHVQSIKKKHNKIDYLVSFNYNGDSKGLHN